MVPNPQNLTPRFFLWVSECQDTDSSVSAVNFTDRDLDANELGGTKSAGYALMAHTVLVEGSPYSIGGTPGSPGERPDKVLQCFVFCFLFFGMGRHL